MLASVWLTFLLCVGDRCERVELPVENLLVCFVQAQPTAAARVAKLLDKGKLATVRQIRCSTGRVV